MADEEAAAKLGRRSLDHPREPVVHHLRTIKDGVSDTFEGEIVQGDYGGQVIGFVDFASLVPLSAQFRLGW